MKSNLFRLDGVSTVKAWYWHQSQTLSEDCLTCATSSFSLSTHEASLPIAFNPFPAVATRQLAITGQGCITLALGTCHSGNGRLHGNLWLQHRGVPCIVPLVTQMSAREPAILHYAVLKRAAAMFCTAGCKVVLVTCAHCGYPGHSLPTAAAQPRCHRCCPACCHRKQLSGLHCNVNLLDN
jgi:hypothetical protein